jgi:hypothetical protein
MDGLGQKDHLVGLIDDKKNHPQKDEDGNQDK